MKINALRLENFRGFENLEIEFNDRINVFIGTNGAGKTTIMDAISMNINHGIARLTTKNENGAFFPEHCLGSNDVNYKSKDCLNQITYNVDGNLIKYQLKKNIFEVGFKFNGKQFEEYFNNIKKEITDQTNLPVVIYYNAQQNYDVSFKEKKSDSRFNQLNAYKNACNNRLFSFSDFTAWFKEQEDIENEVRLRENPNYKLRELSIVRDAISRFLNELTSNTKNNVYSDLSVIRAKPIFDKDFNFTIKSEGELFIKKNNDYIKLEQLSDGEKKLILMIADIASRIAQLNPTLENSLENAEGLVLIDEIEQHLHPAWQRRIIYSLSKTFSTIQWIFTTHSEIVVGSLLDQIQDNLLSHNLINFYFVYDENGHRKIEVRQANKNGQLEGGLKDFYVDLLENEQNPFQ